MSNQSESTIQKIFIGVAIPVLTAAALYSLNLGDKEKEKPSNAKVESVVTSREQPLATNTAVITEDDIKQKELRLKEKELELKSKQLEQQYKNVSSENESSYDLSGNWVGNNGLYYTITQVNNQVNMNEFANLFGSQTVSCYASGIISGNKINGTAIGVMGQQFNFDMNILNERSLNFSFMNFNGAYSTIVLTKQ